MNAFARADDAVGSLNGIAPAVAILELEDNGWSMLRHLHDRYGADVPVVLMSADRTSAAGVVAGPLIGGDDYAVEHGRTPTTIYTDPAMTWKQSYEAGQASPASAPTPSTTGAP